MFFSQVCGLSFGFIYYILCNIEMLNLNLDESTKISSWFVTLLYISESPSAIEISDKYLPIFSSRFLMIFFFI